MAHSKENLAFLASTTPQTKRLILRNIAAHYGVNEDVALAEVTHQDAESLLDYVTGPERAAVSLLMRTYRLQNAVSR